MGCWVVPTVAAEIWGMSIPFVLEAIRDGRLRSKVESGFVLVDADPRGMHLSPGRRPKEQRPPTYTVVVTPEELAALESEPLLPAPALAERSPAEVPGADSSEAFDWRTVRQRVARTRRKLVA